MIYGREVVEFPKAIERFGVSQHVLNSSKMKIKTFFTKFLPH